MSLWRVTVERKDDRIECWIAIVLAATETGARRSATRTVGSSREYRSTNAVKINPYRTGTLLTVQEGVGVQYEREEVASGS